MTKRMLIDATHAEETRVVLRDGSRLEDFDVETSAKRQLKGNIYLAKVVRVEPSLQAAFVEYGGNRPGFLAFSEIHPDYYQIPVADPPALIEAWGQADRVRSEVVEPVGAQPADAVPAGEHEHVHDGEPHAEVAGHHALDAHHDHDDHGHEAHDHDHDAHDHDAHHPHDDHEHDHDHHGHDRDDHGHDEE